MADYVSLPLFTDAWIADTAHLSRVERGLYMDLLILMWRSPNCRVPNELPWISRKLRATADEVQALENVIAEFCKKERDSIAPYSSVAERHVNWSIHPCRWNKGSIWRAARALILMRDKSTCRYCGDTADVMHIDHVVPRALGGTNHSDNLVACCGPCNWSKGSRSLESWVAR